jgi:hypothetical protein
MIIITRILAIMSGIVLLLAGIAAIDGMTLISLAIGTALAMIGLSLIWLGLISISNLMEKMND